MDKERDHIESKIASSFSSQARKAPEGLWSGISDSLKFSDDELAIKNSFSTAETKSAPKAGWASVKRQLIIDEVWSNILAIQERRRRRVIFFWWSGAFGVLALLIGLSWGFWNGSESHSDLKGSKVAISRVKNDSNDSNDSSDENEPLSTESESSKRKNSSIQNSTSSNETSDAPSTQVDHRVGEWLGNQLTVNSGGPVETEEDQSRTNLALARSTETEILESDNGSSETSSIEVAEKPTLDQHQRNSTEQDSETNSQDILIGELPVVPVNLLDNMSESKWNDPILINPIPAFKRFEIGLSAFGGNTWIFNNDVKNGFDSNSLIRNKLSKGYSIGVEGMYNFDLRQSMFLAYDAYSVAQQEYSYYESGRLLDKRITLNQQKILLGYKYNLFHRSSTNFVIRLGGYYTHSIRSTVQVDEMSSSDGNFEKTDFGVNVGGGVEHTLNRFKIEYGIRSDIGLYNITANSVLLPKKFDYASAFILGGYISFRYRF